ncbi:MAG: lipoyl(octanoyl) transferase LipB [Chromatiales bacterium]|nr:lipoyl(octanoyl) transferase LipB [Chromatiales bacterium]
MRAWRRWSYRDCLAAMRAFTDRRDAGTADELWLVEHEPVFTLGLSGRREHLLAPGDIPVVETERGGQVTYHGPGQVVAYPLIDVRRRGIGPRALVTALESAVIELLAGYGLETHADPKAPGVYLGSAKIAAVGLRIRRGASYHGVALNVDMDLTPFARINPCGHPGLAVTQLREHFPGVAAADVAAQLGAGIARGLGYTGTIDLPDSLP